MKKINSFDAACKALKITNHLPDVSNLPEAFQKSVIALYKLMIIAKALNGNWVADWTDYSQYKYYPWFRYVSGSGFVLYDFVYGYTNTGLGSRLVFKSEEIAMYAGKQFTDLYNDMMTNV